MIQPLLHHAGQCRPFDAGHCSLWDCNGRGNRQVQALSPRSFNDASAAQPLSDAMVLFVVMIGVVAVPISIGGWGLRELAVVSLLATHGVAPERALLFSVCFGLALAIGSLPGALAWILFPFPSARRSVARVE